MQGATGFAGRNKDIIAPLAGALRPDKTEAARIMIKGATYKVFRCPYTGISVFLPPDLATVHQAVQQVPHLAAMRPAQVKALEDGLQRERVPLVAKEAEKSLGSEGRGQPVTGSWPAAVSAGFQIPGFLGFFQ